MDEITPSKIFIPPNVELLKEDMQKLKANNFFIIWKGVSAAPCNNYLSGVS